MTRKEAAKILHWMKVFLEDEGRIVMPGEAEHAKYVVESPHVSAADIHRYAREHVLPPGKRGRVRLVLNTPFDARVYAAINGVLLSVKE